MNKETGQQAETSLQASFSPACLHYYRCTIGVCVYLCTCSPEARWPRSRSGAVWSGPDMCASAPVNLPPVQIDIKSLCEMEKEMQGEWCCCCKTSWKDRRMERWKQGWREGKWEMQTEVNLLDVTDGGHINISCVLIWPAEAAEYAPLTWRFSFLLFLYILYIFLYIFAFTY